MATQPQLEANRANSQLSTGPQTPEGKRKVSHNAVKTALTGATVLLPTDDAAAYEQYARNAYVRWQPANQAEEFLVQSILDTEWRLLRIPTLIAATYALGRITHAERFADHPEPAADEPAPCQRGKDSIKRSMLIDAYIEEVSARQLRNLALQDARLTRKRERETAELKELQAERRKRREAQLEAASHMYERYKEEEFDFDPAKFGFEFSIDEIEQKTAYREALRIGCRYPEQYSRYIGNKILMCERLGIDPETYSEE